jgi:hypothetical protein
MFVVADTSGVNHLANAALNAVAAIPGRIFGEAGVLDQLRRRGIISAAIKGETLKRIANFVPKMPKATFADYGLIL